MAAKKKKAKSTKRGRRTRRLRKRTQRSATAPRQMSPPFKKFEERLLGVLRDEERDHFAIGMMWNQLAEQRWAEADLGQSPRRWWKEHVGSYSEPRTAVRLGRIVKHYKDPALLAAEGDARLDDLIAYCRNRFPLPADPRPFLIDFKDPDGNKFSKPFSDSTRRRWSGPSAGITPSPRRRRHLRLRRQTPGPPARREPGRRSSLNRSTTPCGRSGRGLGSAAA
jgi:hypothetical protein